MAKKHLKKTLAGAFAILIVASAVPLAPYVPILRNMCITAAAADGDVTYLVYNESEKKFELTTITAEDYTLVTANTTSMSDGTYVVKGDVEIDTRISVWGNVNLILADGCHLNAPKGIVVKGGNILTISSQSITPEKMGTLTAAAESYNAAIGSRSYESFGTVIVNGGNINATGGAYGAGIGTVSYAREQDNGYVIINGGNLKTGGSSTDSTGLNGIVTINGGTINAFGGQYASAIGGGPAGSSLTINGGSLVLTPSPYMDARCIPKDQVISVGENAKIITSKGQELKPADGQTWYDVFYANKTISFETVVEHTHAFCDELYDYDDNGHWHACLANNCNVTDFSTGEYPDVAFAEHEDADEDFYCDICGYFDEAAALPGIQAAAKDEIDAEVPQDASDAVTVIAAGAKMDVDAATSVKAVKEIVARAKSDIAAQIAAEKELAAAKGTAYTEIDASVSDDDSDAVKAIAEKAKTDVEEAESVSDVEGIVEQAKTDIENKRLEEKELAEAKETAYGDIDAAVPSEASDAVKVIAEKAKADVEEAESVSDVEGIVEQAKTDIAARIAEEEALPSAKETAYADIDAAVPTNASDAVKAIAEQAKADVEAADSISEVEGIVAQAKTDIAAQIDAEQALVSAKETACADIDAAAPTSASNAVKAIAEKAKADVEAADSISEVEDIVAQALADIQAVIDSEPKEPIFVGSNAVIEGDIGMVFHAFVPTGFTDGSVTISMKRADDVTYTSDEFVRDAETGYYVFRYNVNAIQMGESVTAIFYDKDHVEVARASLTVEEYLTALYENENTSINCKNLSKAILTYGFYAQQALSSANGWKIGVDYAAMTGTYEKPADCSSGMSLDKVQKEGSDDSVSRLQVSVLFDHAVALNLYITSDTKPSVSVDYEAAEVTEVADGVWKLVIPNHQPSSFGIGHVVIINDKLTVYGLSPMSYANLMVNSEDADQVNLANAFYLYYMATL